MSSNEWKRNDPAELAKARAIIESRLAEITRVVEGLRIAQEASRSWVQLGDPFRKVSVDVYSAMKRLEWHKNFYTKLLKPGYDGCYFGNMAVIGNQD